MCVCVCIYVCVVNSNNGYVNTDSYHVSGYSGGVLLSLPTLYLCCQTDMLSLF